MQCEEVNANASDVLGELFYRWVHRFLPSGMDSELASNGIQSDRFFAGSTGNYLGKRVAPGLLFKPVSKNIYSTVASSADKRSSRSGCRFGGVLMFLKMIVLSSSALVLWLAPLVGLDKKVGWHKSIQGLSLSVAVACAVSAGNIGRHLADESEIQELKTRAIKADVEDEIATEVYISQAQRQQEAEAVLNPVERLERALALSCGDEDGTANVQNEIQAEDVEEQRAERVLELKAKGWGKAKIILEVWGVSKGGSQKYKDAETLYERLIRGET